MIFTPRTSIEMLGTVYFNARGTNPAVNTVIAYKGYEISIAMDSSHTDGDLSRSEIMVWPIGELNFTGDVTNQFFVDGETRLDGTGVVLKRIMDKIDTLSKEVAL